MSMFMVEGRVGRMAVRAETSRKARAMMSRRYGTSGGPYNTKPASEEDLREHLSAGAQFFEANGGVIPKAEAYALAGQKNDG